MNSLKDKYISTETVIINPKILKNYTRFSQKIVENRIK